MTTVVDRAGLDRAAPDRAAPDRAALYERLVRPVLFRQGGGDAEVAHDRTLRALAAIARVPALAALLHRWYAVAAPRTVFGLTFPNPVGLAAGLDKNAVAVRAWAALGFGFIEIGTVTARAQEGNPAPRLFRLPDSQAVINRMGFANDGAVVVADRLARAGRVGVPLGVSLGKSKATPLEGAVADYETSFRALYPYGDYFVLNVSSPNTPGLRSLQRREHLVELVDRLRAVAAELAGDRPSKPLLVKIAPDLAASAIADVVDVCLTHGVAGLIATNTTLRRDGLAPREVALGAQAGGLSGRPLAARAREVVAFVQRETAGRLPIVGVGGILGPDDAARLFDAGARLVQICTGLIYRGPGLVAAINRAQDRRPARAQDRRGRVGSRSRAAEAGAEEGGAEGVGWWSALGRG